MPVFDVDVGASSFSHNFSGAFAKPSLAVNGEIIFSGDTVEFSAAMLRNVQAKYHIEAFLCTEGYFSRNNMTLYLPNQEVYFHSWYRDVSAWRDLLVWYDILYLLENHFTTLLYKGAIII